MVSTRRPSRSAPTLEHPALAKSEELAKANYYAAIFGAAPRSFTSAVQQLRLDARDELKYPSESSEFQLRRLLNGPTFLANMYYAAKTYRPEAWEQNLVKEPFDLVRSFDLRTISALITLSYLFKRAKRLSDQDEWRYLGDPIETFADVGMLIADALDNVDACSAILSGPMLLIGMAAFLAEDKKEFQKYRRELKGRRLFDPIKEMTIWGCTSYDVASCLLVMMGFSAADADAFRRGFSSCAVEPLPPDVLSFRVMHVCLGDLANKSLKRQGPKLREALAAAQAAVETGSRHRWLSRTRADADPSVLVDLPGVEWERTTGIAKKLSPRANVTAPEAAPKPKQPVPEEQAGGFEQPDLPQRCKYEELPAELRAEISVGEFEQLKHMSCEEIVSLFS